MSLVVQCDTCRDPEHPRRVVQWRVGSCRECCGDPESRHLAEHPDHQVSVAGSVSSKPFGVPVRVERLFGRKIA